MVYSLWFMVYGFFSSVIHYSFYKNRTAYSSIISGNLFFKVFTIKKTINHKR